MKPGTRTRNIFLLVLFIAFSGIFPAPAPFQVPAPLKNLGEPINTPGDELYPTVSSDGRTMIFAAKRNGIRYYDLFITQLDDVSGWSRPESIPVLNSPYNDESPFLTPDGNLIIFASDRDGSHEMDPDAQGNIRVSFDLYWSRKVKGNWTKPVPVPGDVNTKDHERFPAFSEDRKELYYSSWPFGDLEKSRIMRSELKAGKYQRGELLPASINSGNREVQFFPAPEKNGFILSSSRPGGLGGWDLYYVSYKDGVFGEPVNLGADVNSDGNEAAGAMSVDGHIFVSALRRDSLGGYDIYGTRTKPVEYSLAFFTREKGSGEALSVPLLLEAATDRPLPGALGDKLKKPTDEEGMLTVLVHPAVSRLQVLVDADGYLPVQLTLDPREVYQKQGEKPTILDLEPMKEGASFDVREIHFDYDSAKIRPESYPYLNDLLYYLKKHEEIRLEIIGHTDLHGAADYNLRLSKSRAESVKQFLVENGLSPERFETTGAGMTQPIVRGTGEPYDSQNRRTEFRILGAK